MTRRAVYKDGHWVEVTGDNRGLWDTIDRLSKSIPASEWKKVPQVDQEAVERRERMIGKLSLSGKVRDLIHAGWLYRHPEAKR